MNQLWAVILAAGEGKRMHSTLPKVLHPLCGKPLLNYVIESAAALTEQITVVVGHGALQVQEKIGGSWRYVLQEKQLGTGHAVMQALPHLPTEGKLLVLCGDTPLLTVADLERLVTTGQDCAAVVATTELPDPTGYGRIIRNDQGLIESIVEERDATGVQKSIREINTGTYYFDLGLLRSFLPRLNTENAQQEYYLTDILSMLYREGHAVVACQIEDYRVGLGINNRVQLAEATREMRKRINETLMQKGVTIIDPAATYIDSGVSVGADTVIWPGSILERGTVVGSGCVIGPQAHLRQTTVEDEAVVSHAVLEQTVVPRAASIGPYVHLVGLAGNYNS